MKKGIFSILLILSLTLNFQQSFSQGKNMRLLGKLNPTGFTSGINYSAIWGYTAPDGREYAILGGFTGTHFIDITDSTNIHQVGFVSSVLSDWREMKTYSHYAYIVSEGFETGVQIVDLADLPNSIRYVGKYTALDHKRSHTIQQEGPYLYINGSNTEFGQGVAVLDLSVNPEQPVLRGKWSDSYIHDCRVINDTIWSGGGTINAISAVNKDNLSGIVNWTNGPNSFAHNMAISPGRKYMYVLDESATPVGRLKIWNIQNLSDILLVNIWTPSPVFQNTIVHNVELYGNLLLMAYYTGGLKVLDVSTPSNPQEIGWYDTYPESNLNNWNGCWGVYMFPSGKIIASDRTRGLFVLRYTPPQNAAPKADFMYDRTAKYYGGDTVQFIEASSNNPTSYQWTITGAENLSSTLPNPKLKITGLGNYTVKLKVTNAFGSDSITKSDLRIYGPVLVNPLFTNTIIQTINTSRFDTSKVKFSWTNASRGSTGITYKFRVRKNGLPADSYYISSDNNGADTIITFRKSRLDSIAGELGFSGDSVVTTCRLTAYNGLDSITSGNALLITFKSASVGVQNISTQIPDKFKLENNYPNPFNPSTNIKFQLAEKSFASIIIYDMLGREVKKILSEELNAGYYNFQFNAGNLNSGVYFYKLITEKFSETKKMLLVK